ncbi:MAG: UDP-N-acetylmuramoyl-L-alanine--D-glutamate ligase, partial [Proteobacteria bacterium]|nr:UDP-N-acetylmuramoyl-L-alanine--D-glutamate ligase [Pseudomonadota bacterium]
MKKQTSPYFLVIGLGTSGVSMARFLRSKGETVVATDIDASRMNIEKQLNKLGIQTEIGFHNQQTFDQAEILVPSPGIPLTNAFIRTAVKRGVKMTSELDIFTRYNTLPVIAITGTNGKTTTTTLIGEMLKGCGMNPFVGGNIGTPLVDQLMAKEKADVVVAEISSFQLDISTLFKPTVGVLLNISEDHLDRYENYGAYEASKWSMFKRQESCDAAVINQSIKGIEKACQKLKSTIFTFSSSSDIPTKQGANIGSDYIEIITKTVHKKIPTIGLKELHGTHNRENMAAAVLACLALGADITGILKGALTFKNLAHRMEHIKTIDQISFYDDSKATNTDAVVRALECFKKNVILILGGREKNTDFSLLIKEVKTRVKTIIAIGESKEHIKDTFKNTCRVLAVKTMEEA